MLLALQVGSGLAHCVLMQACIVREEMSSLSTIEEFLSPICLPMTLTKMCICRSAQGAQLPEEVARDRTEHVAVRAHRTCALHHQADNTSRMHCHNTSAKESTPSFVVPITSRPWHPALRVVKHSGRSQAVSTHEGWRLPDAPSFFEPQLC